MLNKVFGSSPITVTASEFSNRTSRIRGRFSGAVRSPAASKYMNQTTRR